MASVNGRGEPLLHRATDALERFFRVYAQILFSRSPVTGALLFLATSLMPVMALFGVLAVLVADATARLLGLRREVIAEGTYGYNALLIGLGMGHFYTPSPGLLLVTALVAAASVVLTAALRSWLGGVNLPILTLPFIVVLALVLGSAPLLGLAQAPADDASSVVALDLPVAVVAFVRSLGALFFLPRLDAGAIVLVALLVHSRISTVLAATAFALIYLLATSVFSLPHDSMLLTLGYNGMLTAVALGAVWFVPSSWSFGLGLAGALLSTVLALGSASSFARMALPVGIFPLNAAILLVLFAVRQRARDERPRSVDFESGTPEENLAYARATLARFGRLYLVPFRLPFRGTWTCTQAVDGAHTHKDQWRHGFDFEVSDAEGRFCGGAGLTVQDFFGFRLPVLATADGTVVEVESSVPDNAVGSMNLEKNWGNYVILYHAVGLYSLVAHLAKGSVKVTPGQVVKSGDVLGLSGNSGRSPRPHVHFHLQATHELGAATLPCSFNDVIMVKGGALELVPSRTPLEGDTLRNPSPNDEVAAFFELPLGATFRFQVGKAVERVLSEVDLLGRYTLRSLDRKACLYYGKTPELFTVYDAAGESSSVLHLLRAALSRAPFDAEEELRWTDELPARRLRPWLSRVLLDLVSPFASRDRIEMVFQMRRDKGVLVVTGESTQRDRKGAPVVQTRIELQRGAGPRCVELTVRGRALRAERAAEDEAEVGSGKSSARPAALAVPAVRDA